jgi:glycosyltransferase involved in cell wall biosynthesis
MLLAPPVFPEEVQFGLAEAYLATVAPLADINVATSFTTIRPTALLSGRKFYFGQHYEAYFAQESNKPAFALAVAEQSYRLGFEMIANSTWLKAELCSEAGLNHVHLCPNAIDHRTFYGEPRRCSQSKKVVVISYGGRDAVWKGFREMAEAVAIARSKTLDVEIEWRVYGSALLPPDNPIAHYKALGFLPPKILSEAYRDADFLLSASWYESFPLFPIEAMASGLAVITTQPGTEEYAIPGRTAEVVQPHSVESIAAGILKLIRDPEYRYRIASEGNRISRQFTWKSSVERFESIILNQ